MIDLLEPRRLLAAAPVNVTGTAAKDVIQIDVGIDSYFVTVNGVRSDYPALNVSTFIISAGDGDDIVLIGAGVVGVYADGGNGNDKIVGGDGPDTFLGAAGKDQIYGGGGNDRINGAGGNDKVFGEVGGDRFYGGAGDDYLDGGFSSDRIYPSTGTDQTLGDDPIADARDFHQRAQTRIGRVRQVG